MRFTSVSIKNAQNGFVCGTFFSFLSVFPDYTLASMEVLLHDKQNNNNPYRNDIQTMQIIKKQKLMGITKKYILSYTV